MDLSQYTVDGDAIQALSTFLITKFFDQNKPLTQEDCDRKAADIAGGPIRPTFIQGVTSYTVLAGTDCQKIVQFRIPRAAFDVDLLQYARQAYSDRFVPACESFGTLGQLHVYLMDHVPGVAFALAQRQFYSPEGFPLLSRTVGDFALFFASAWHNTPASMPLPDPAALSDEYSARLAQLRQRLPLRFHPKLHEAQKHLPLLFMPNYPLVLNHGDLLEMNIHVDPETGSVTGIVDWPDAKVAPFGTSLWGLETILGIMTGTGWRFHPDHRELRRIFWKVFYTALGGLSDTQRQAIEIARLVGIFHAFGFLKGSPVEEGSPGFMCLEAFVLGLDGDSL